MVCPTPRSRRNWPERKALSANVPPRRATRFERGRPMNTIVKTQSGEMRGSVDEGVHTFI
jgi:hypothetical protein